MVRGYDGPEIIWGRKNNKHKALRAIEDYAVPIPRLFSDIDYIDTWPVVGRPDHHSKGRHFYYCINPYQAYSALSSRRPPTHWLEWIEADREFRVHVVNGGVIKISEKSPVGNYKQGESYFHYPHDFHHKRTLREVSIKAVEALGFAFGAVDVLWRQPNDFYVLEVNTAPRLTDEKSDTLERYVQAFMLDNMD